MNFRRLLILTDGMLNDGTGSGITLGNLFKGWLPDKLKVYSVQKDRGSTGLLSYKSCYIAHDNGPENRRNTVEATNNDQPRYLKSKLIKLLRPYLTPFLPVSINAETISEIIKYEPELIYSPVSDIYSIRRVQKIYKLSKAELNIVIFDDLLNRYDDIPLAYFMKKLHMYYLKSVINSAKNVFACSEQMNEEYARIFNRKFYVVSNPVDLNKVNLATKNHSQVSGEFRIIYAGTINTKNINSLIILANIIEKLSENGTGCSFNVLTFSAKFHEAKELFSKYKATSVRLTPTNDDELFRILASASLLYLPIDFSQESIKSIRLSYLTKQPLYMSLGVPLVVHGPRDVHIVQHALENDYATVLVSERPKDLESIIIDHINSPEIARSKMNNGYRYAAQHHEISIVQQNFYKKLLNE